MDIINIFQQASEMNATDIFMIAGKPITVKVFNKLVTIGEERLLPDMTYQMIKQTYELGKRDFSILEKHGDDDFSFSIHGLSRFRISTYKQRGSYAAVIRVISFDLPIPKEIGISDEIIHLVDIKKGLILVTGPAGSGKSTTQACMIDHINKTQSKHIITLEDPIEYLHSHNQSIVSQREISLDSESYVSALRAALRQAPDVILLGEMRDFETINIALTAAETGHNVISTLHTLGAASTIDRIIDVFPANQQHQIAIQLSMTLETVISQQLVPTIDGKLIPAFEIMVVTPAIRNMIRDNKIHQIDGVIASNADSRMISMDNSLLRLYNENVITRETALLFSTNPELMERKLKIK